MLLKRQLLVATLVIAAPGLALAQEPEGEPADAETPAPLPPGDPVEQFEAIIRETDSLIVYNDLLQRQIESQEQDLNNIQQAIGQVPGLERQIPPLITRIIEGLERFIELDMPFLAEERAERLAELKGLVEQTNANDAEKMRRVMEAWEIENEYGRGYSAYVGQLEIDGMTREVDFLRVGRLALVYQTTDDAMESGVWDPRVNAWQPLGSEHRNSVRQALRMARNQVAPDMVLLPVTPPQE